MPILILCLVASGVATTVGHSLVRDDVADRGRPRLHSTFIRNLGAAYLFVSLVLVVTQ